MRTSSPICVILLTILSCACGLSPIDQSRNFENYSVPISYAPYYGPSLNIRPEAYLPGSEKYKIFETINENISNLNCSGDCIIFIGDSITELWNREGTDVWNNNYLSRKAINAGIAGDQIEHVLWRIRYGAYYKIQPMVAVLLIGTNDVENGDDYKQIYTGILQVTHELEIIWPNTKIFVTSILPTQQPNNNSGVRATVNSLLQQALTEKPGWLFIDASSKFLDEAQNPINACYIDKFHLSEYGYEALADSYNSYIESAFAGLDNAF